MRTLAAVLLLSFAAFAEGELTLCLEAAADGSPVYPLKFVPAHHREAVVVFRVGETETIANLQHVWTAVDVGEAAPPNTEIVRGELALRGVKTGAVRCRLPRDLPAGTYRLDVAADGKPWAALGFSVEAAEERAPPEAPVVPLEPGRSWTYSWVLEAGPVARNLTVAGLEKDADGKFRTTMRFRVVGKDEDVARIEMSRAGAVVAEERWALTAEGLAVTQVSANGATSRHEPPLPMIALPLRRVHAWTHRPAGGAAVEYRMWGPLPVKAPSGEAPGWIVWSRTSDGLRVSTVERRFVPGVGVVRESHVDAVGPKLLTRIEIELQPPE